MSGHIVVNLSVQIQQIRDRIERAAQAIMNSLPDAEQVVRDLEQSSDPICRMVAKYYRKLEATMNVEPPTHIIAGETPGWLKAAVYLNGEKLDLCVEADSAAGWAVVYVRERGRFQIDEHGEPKTRMLFGNVEIRMNTDDQSPA